MFGAKYGLCVFAAEVDVTPALRHKIYVESKIKGMEETDIFIANLALLRILY